MGKDVRFVWDRKDIDKMIEKPIWKYMTRTPKYWVFQTISMKPKKRVNKKRAKSTILASRMLHISQKGKIHYRNKTKARDDK